MTATAEERRRSWPRRHKVLTVLLALAALFALLVGLGLALGSGGPSGFTAHGTEQLCTSPLLNTSPDDFPDITSGAQVTVTDPSGKVIGSGALSADPKETVIKTAEERAVLEASTGVSNIVANDQVYDFTVTSLPAGQPRYGISIGHRGTVWYSEKQMRGGPSVTLNC
jgi:hypothetical protein